VGLLAAWRFPEARLVGVEAQAQSLGLARRSARYNGIEGRSRFVLGDLRDSARLLDGERPFDLVLGSPPYLPQGAGVVSERPQCGPCRFEDRGGVEGYCEAARRHLSVSGTFALVYTDRDRGRVRAAAQHAALRVCAEQPVVTRWGDPPLLRLFALQLASSGGGPESAAPPAAKDPPLVVRLRSGQHSEPMREVRALMGFPPGRRSRAKTSD